MSSVLHAPERATYIYALVDPQTNEVRYVGLSIHPKIRFSEHVAAKRGGHRSRWIKELRQRGQKPVLRILEETTMTLSAEREQYWIAWHRSQGALLTNLTDGGDSILGCLVGPKPLRSRKKQPDASVFEGGSGNVFADLGLPNAEDRHAKSQRAMAIGDTIAAQRLTQRAAAFKVGEGLTQADVSHILHGRLRGYSVARLMDILTALGNDVLVSIRPTRDGGRGTFAVHGELVVTLATCSAEGD